ncbi:ATP-binding cassette domain-containing protein [candidate division KSB3 bacterium]|uniref:ATP-binding cassette domain-containing protein n=1 Tax=candidate division KSB3 bacterium TaxID=2044937 RepID=A0A9D5Q739_9BACT|nr:ATP-binding cassette domain-containing protein [candidate division KSB3 bacterium]MBD3326519.1 ATP-binding cassette domain-containing protein [candidate division KSB3 bacterium]
MKRVLLRTTNISKHFGGIQALKGIDLEIFEGEVCALVGENGAGKSTLAKIIAGVQTYDSGTLYFDEKPVDFHSTNEAMQAGIAIVLQEFNLIPHLSIAENIFLTHPEAYRGGFWLNRPAIQRKTLDLFDQIGWELNVDPARKVSALTVAEQQIVEILKAISLNARLVILDEPTAALSQQEVQKLFDLVRRLQAQGTTIIFVTHKLEEVFTLSERIIVLRDGSKMREFITADTTSEELIRSMVGRDIGDLYEVRQRNSVGDPILTVQELSRDHYFHKCSLEVCKGEIVGISGLVGAGRTELVRAIFGADTAEDGSVTLRGKVGLIQSPVKAIQAGMAMVPEDRKSHGLLTELPIYQNMMLAFHALQPGFWIHDRQEHELVMQQVENLQIKAPRFRGLANSLSGGNQQKVVLAKWLLTQPELLILDEPTRGIDIGAKFELYQLIDHLASTGAAILLVSSELPEILALSDRILVMNSGKIVMEFHHTHASEEAILAYAARSSNGDHITTKGDSS